MRSVGRDRRQLLGGALAGAACLSIPLLAPSRGRAQTSRHPTTIANGAGVITLVMGELMKRRGFFEEFGLDAKVVYVADGSKILGGMIGGDIDSSMISGIGQVFPAIAKGARLKLLAAANLVPGLAVFTSKPDIASLKDLEGRTVGVGSIGALLHQLMVALLRKKGVDVAKVRFVNIGSSGDVFRATTMGTIDAGLGDVSILDHLDKFKLRAVAGGNMAVELTEYTYSGSWTSERMIQSHRDVLVRTLAAYAKLYRYVQNPQAKDEFRLAWLAVLPHAEPADIEDAWNYTQRYNSWAVDLTLEPKKIDYMQRLNVDLGIQGEVLPMSRIADMSLAQDALTLVGRAG